MLRLTRNVRLPDAHRVRPQQFVCSSSGAPPRRVRVDSSRQRPHPNVPSEQALAADQRVQETVALVAQPRQRRRSAVSVLRSQLCNKQVVTQDTAESLGYVQDLLVALSRLQVVTLNLKPRTIPFTGVDKNIALSELQQIGDVVLVRDRASLSRRGEYDQETVVTTLIGLDVRLGGAKVGKVRDFSFDPATGKVVSIKYDRFSYAATLPGDLRDRMPTFPQQLVTIYSVGVAEVYQVTAGSVELYSDAKTLQDNSTGILDTVVDTVTRSSLTEGHPDTSRPALSASRNAPTNGMSLLPSPQDAAYAQALQQWSARNDEMCRQFTDSMAGTSATLAGQEPQPAERQPRRGQPQQPLQMRASEPASYVEGGQRAPRAAGPAAPSAQQRRPVARQRQDGSVRDPRSRINRSTADSPQQPRQYPQQQPRQPPGYRQGPSTAPNGAHRDTWQTASSSSGSTDMRRFIGDMRQQLPRQPSPPQGKQGNRMQARDAREEPTGMDFLREQKPRLFGGRK